MTADEAEKVQEFLTNLISALKQLDALVAKAKTLQSAPQSERDSPVIIITADETESI
jgi:hypothetical protein